MHAQAGVFHQTGAVGASVALRAAVLQCSGVAGLENLRGGGTEPLERSLAMIKPDAVAAGNADNIKKAIEESGFKIVAEKKIHLTKAQV